MAGTVPATGLLVDVAVAFQGESMNILSRQIFLSLAALLPVLALPPSAASAATGIILYADSVDAVKDSYIVVLKDSAPVDSHTAALAATYSAKVRHTFRTTLHGFAATMTEPDARRLAADPTVAYVQQDAVVRAFDTQPNPPSWGLDRIDQAELPLNNSYTYTSSADVHVYVIDTGIRTTHTTFGGRAVWGINTTGDGNNTDCNGHGTHVAGTIGGLQYGVAKNVRLVAVKVLGCNGSGTFSSIIAGIDWVTANAVRPAVANVSLGGPGANAALENAMRNSITRGITYVVAAGNSNANACNFTPARVFEAITVSASDINDNKASFSNFGICADLFAPGVNITSSWNVNDTVSHNMSGTSMSTAHVTGAVARALSDQVGQTPQELLNKISSDFVYIKNWTQEMAVRKILIGPGTPVSYLAPELRISWVNSQIVQIVNEGRSDAFGFWVLLSDLAGRREWLWIHSILAHGYFEVRFQTPFENLNCGVVTVDDTDEIAETNENNNRQDVGICVK